MDQLLTENGLEMLIQPFRINHIQSSDLKYIGDSQLLDDFNVRDSRIHERFRLAMNKLGIQFLDLTLPVASTAAAAAFPRGIIVDSVDPGVLEENTNQESVGTMDSGKDMNEESVGTMDSVKSMQDEDDTASLDGLVVKDTPSPVQEDLALQSCSESLDLETRGGDTDSDPEEKRVDKRASPKESGRQDLDHKVSATKKLERLAGEHMNDEEYLDLLEVIMEDEGAGAPVSRFFLALPDSRSLAFLQRKLSVRKER